LDKTVLIITCRGIKHDGRIVSCSFLHDGNWGDEELNKHQFFHESSLDPNTFWLGFDCLLPFGKFSDRDGKQS